MASLVWRELLCGFCDAKIIETSSEKFLSYCTLVIISTKVFMLGGLMLQKTHFLR